MAEDKYMENVENGLIMTDDDEIKRLQDKIDLHEKALEDYKEKRSLSEQFQKVIRDNIRKIEPEFEYQQKDEYWNINKKLSEIRHKQELRDIDITIERLEKTINTDKEKLENLKGGNDE